MRHHRVIGIAVLSFPVLVCLLVILAGIAQEAK